MLDELIYKKWKRGDGVKQILYKNPVASMVTLNLFTFLIYIFWFYKTIGILIFIPLAVLNRRVIINSNSYAIKKTHYLWEFLFYVWGFSLLWSLSH